MSFRSQLSLYSVVVNARLQSSPGPTPTPDMVPRVKSRKVKKEGSIWVLCSPRSTAPFGVPHRRSTTASPALQVLDSASLQLTSYSMSYKDPGVQDSELASSSLPQGPLQTAIAGEPLQPVTLARPQVWLQGSPTLSSSFPPSSFLSFSPLPPQSFTYPGQPHPAVQGTSHNNPSFCYPPTPQKKEAAIP